MTAGERLEGRLLLTAARDAREQARRARVAARSARGHGRLLCGQAAALRAKLRASPGRAVQPAQYEALVGDLLASAGVLADLAVRRERGAAELLALARDAHRRLLTRYAAFGPSLPT